jgi:hypothetical protein
VDRVVVLNMIVAIRGVVVEFVVNLGHGSSGFSAGKNLNISSRLPVVNTSIVGTP